ncbi:type II toxin-antitoxin system VapB family antitoxin [Comamonas sp. NLF-1-9]|uniref:type II toxin-antitoxin system VapB family antitoxin n=1 Tax=Comamonas sp. NLF-1-9 TaxID=2853163 RepID=UPI001C46DFBD|nr:type II toxin-antitoxin system VapB family antitoxin [Comamonas sp. NLF-1-9]QXL84376.1 type II toxin-antitoxin system VapB family antitoxin [Comamonas sp. NLF-1-9]
MRTNIDIDDDLLAKAMQAGPYTTKKDTVEAGLRLLARQAAYREILKWRGKLKWEGDESIDWTQPDPETEVDEAPTLVALEVNEGRADYRATRAKPPAPTPANPTPEKRHRAGR